MTTLTEIKKLILRQAPFEKVQILFEKVSDHNGILHGDTPDSLIHLAVVNDRLDIVKLL